MRQYESGPSYAYGAYGEEAALEELKQKIKNLLEQLALGNTVSLDNFPERVCDLIAKQDEHNSRFTPAAVANIVATAYYLIGDGDRPNQSFPLLDGNDLAPNTLIDSAVPAADSNSPKPFNYTLSQWRDFLNRKVGSPESSGYTAAAVVSMEPKANRVAAGIVNHHLVPTKHTLVNFGPTSQEAFENIKSYKATTLLYIGHGTTHDRRGADPYTPQSITTIGKKEIFDYFVKKEREEPRYNLGVVVKIDMQALTMDQKNALSLMGDLDVRTGNLRITDEVFSLGLATQGHTLDRAFFATCFSKKLVQRVVDEHPTMQFAVGYDGPLPIWLAEMVLPALYLTLSELPVDKKDDIEKAFLIVLEKIYLQLKSDLLCASDDISDKDIQRAKHIAAFYLQNFVLVMKSSESNKSSL